jgi:hypothetical protein
MLARSRSHALLESGPAPAHNKPFGENDALVVWSKCRKKSYERVHHVPAPHWNSVMGRVCTIQKFPAADPILQRPHNIHTGQVGGLAFLKFDSGSMLQHELKRTRGRSVCVPAKTGGNSEE